MAYTLSTGSRANTTLVAQQTEALTLKGGKFRQSVEVYFAVVV